MGTGHLEQISGDGFSLTAFFRFQSGVCAGGVEQRDYRPVEFSGEPHEPQRLTVSFRVRHPEAPVLPAFHVAPFLVSQDHDGAVDASVFGAAKLRKPSHDRGIVSIQAVAVQFHKVFRHGLDVIERVRPHRVARDLYALPPCQIAVNGCAQFVYAGLQRGDFPGQVDLRVFRVECPHFVELLLEFHERFFEIQKILRRWRHEPMRS